MPKFVIERDLPGPGMMSPDELAATAAQSNKVLAESHPDIQWQHSYITDKMYCLYVAPDAKAVREHTGRGGFLADAVNRVGEIIDPTTGEGD